MPRNDARARFPNKRQFALAYLRYVIACEIAGDGEKFGGIGALLASLAHLLVLPVARNMEAASRFGRVQSSAWTQLGRERGNLQLIRGEPVKISRDRLYQSDQIAAFTGREKAHESHGGRN